MSHFVTIQTRIRDLEALKEACAELGLQVTDNAEARGFAGQARHGDHVIRLKGPYDIAVNRQDDGGYSLSSDTWEGHVEREVGVGHGRLFQLYAVHKAMREARRKGHAVRRCELPNGLIQLTVSS